MESVGLFAFYFVCLASFALDSGMAAIFDVTNFGAVGDNGITDDTNAFKKAWNAFCGCTSENPTMLIPSGKIFLLSPTQFKGPCNAPQLYIKLLGNIVGPRNLDGWTNCAGHTEHFWILFANVSGLVIDGPGYFDGQGSHWWGKTVGSSSCQHPAALHFQKCDGLRLQGTSHINSPRIHIGVYGSSDVNIGHIHISAPENSPNTDGIDISNSAHVNLHDSFIGTGDDCVAINGGTFDINVTGVTCGPGHGISIGSLGENGNHDTAEQVRVTNCNISSTTNGLRIKTVQGGTGYAKNIIFEHIQLTNVKNPIIINQYYCLEKPCTYSPSAVAVSGITYRNIQGSSATHLGINLNCSEKIHCTNIMMDQVDITGPSVSSGCSNAHGTFINTSPQIFCS